ncbi:MAG: hypothetical protein IJO79_02375 [Firmicutes bacterium]|nr:hypothetical protein [Clostridiales bacterium]MBQ9931173.1 hypothetical protein [Bacillota bacterium]
MKNITIKKIGIMGGAAVGGVIGGSVSMVGKLTKVKFLDELGSNIVDSTIETGKIAGDIASGLTHVAVGAVKKQPERIPQGKQDLKRGGGAILNNYVDNFRTIVDNSGELVMGIKTKDGRRVLNGAKTLGKIAAISMITVGAIKVDTEKEPSEKEKEKPRG